MAYTLVTFHAHPDDEAIATGGVMAKAAADGHRVVLVVATRGEHGEVAEDVLDAGETLAARRVIETQRAAELLGVARVEFLGYTDSGMMGTPENDAAGSFWSAPVEEAAQRLATILGEERADVSDRVRRERWLRPPRPHPGPSRRPPSRHARRHARRVREHDQPGPHPSPDARRITEIQEHVERPS